MRVQGQEEMNRNEYYEWKKERVKELAKTGMKVADIAKEMNMGEEDMYSFLSRNFGGVRRLRESVGINPKNASSRIPTENKNKPPQIDFNTAVNKIKNKDMPRIGVTQKQPTIVETFRESLRREKENILQGFKQELLEDKEELVEEMKAGLETAKIELLNNFKDDILKDLTKIAEEI